MSEKIPRLRVILTGLTDFSTGSSEKLEMSALQATKSRL
jgi:hypothetical protein